MASKLILDCHVVKKKKFERMERQGKKIVSLFIYFSERVSKWLNLKKWVYINFFFNLPHLLQFSLVFTKREKGDCEI